MQKSTLCQTQIWTQKWMSHNAKLDAKRDSTLDTINDSKLDAILGPKLDATIDAKVYS